MTPENKNKIELVIYVIMWLTLCGAAGTHYFTTHWWIYSIMAWLIVMFGIIPCWRKL